jgi:hypothetical protein
MLEIKVTIEIPQLAGAITRLADALSGVTFVRATKAVEVAEAPEIVPMGMIGPQENVRAEPQKHPTKTPAETAPAPDASTSATAKAIPVPETAPNTAAPNAPETAVPVAEESAPQEVKTYKLDDIANAMAELIDAGKMSACMKTIRKYGVPAINLLKQDQYPAFAEDLKALGAKL